jgi:hypothetical protein
MNRRFGPLFLLAMLFGAMTSCGADGCGCGRKAPTEAPAATGEAAIVLEASPPGSPPSPAPESLLAAVDALAPRIPVQAAQVAVFPASRVHAALESLPAGLPRLAYAMNADEFQARLRTLYGVDLSDVSGMCAFVRLPDAGPVTMCPGGSLSQVKGSYRWVNGKTSGHNVPRNGVEISLGLVDGFLAVGSVEAVRRVVLVSQGAWPRLSDARSRWMPRLIESAGVDPLGHSALFFLDPATAPWCGEGLCASSAVFASEDAVVGVAQAAEGKGASLQATATAWWNDVGTAFGDIQGRPEHERLMRMPDAWLKPADLLVRSTDFVLREDQLVFQGSGDPIILLIALNAELPQRWLSEMPRTPAAP